MPEPQGTPTPSGSPAGTPQGSPAPATQSGQPGSPIVENFEEKFKGLQGTHQKTVEELNAMKGLISQVREANPWAVDWTDEQILNSVIRTGGRNPSQQPDPDNPEPDPDDPAEAAKKQMQNVLGVALGSSLHTRKYIDRNLFLQQNPDLAKPENSADLEKLDKTVQEEMIRSGDPRRLGDSNLYARVRSRMIAEDPAYADSYYNQRKAKEDQERAEKEKNKGASPAGGLPLTQSGEIKYKVETKGGPKSVKVFVDEVE